QYPTAAMVGPNSPVQAIAPSIGAYDTYRDIFYPGGLYVQAFFNAYSLGLRLPDRRHSALLGRRRSDRRRRHLLTAPRIVDDIKALCQTFPPPQRRSDSPADTEDTPCVALQNPSRRSSKGR